MSDLAALCLILGLMSGYGVVLFKYSKRRNYSIKEIKNFNFQYIDYINFQNKLLFKVLKNV